MVKLLQQKERKRIIDLIQQYILNENGLALKKISNDIAKDGIMVNSKGLIYFSYYPYILYKILTQPHLVHASNWDINKKKILEYLDTLEDKDLEEYIPEINNFISLVKAEDRELYYYMKNILDKAKVKRAAYCCEHGMSVNKAITITDADRMKLIRYLNISKIHYDLGKDVIRDKVGLIEDFFESNK